uniref:Putative cytochrome P450 n=1 Tax=Eschscholzia californica subsp. californica TaxID=222997 RepID=A0A2Z6BXX3_ESCCA|nr:putative cytochrome P450 [Eschscholzia californica subsp. californica]
MVECLMECQAILMAISLTVISFFFSLCYLKYSRKKSMQAIPEPKGALPIIGHLHLLGSSKVIARTLGAMADECGPVFMIRLGTRRALVVSNSKVAKECLSKNDSVLATRPSLIAGEHLGYNYTAISFSSNGPTLRSMRKIAKTELLSTKRIQILKPFIDSEIDMCIRDLYEMWVTKNIGEKKPISQDMGMPILVEMKEWFENLTLNLIVRVLAGKKHFASLLGNENEEDSKICKKAIAEFLFLMGVFVVGDAFPCLRWVDWGGHEGAMKRIMKELDSSILDKWVEEHLLKRSSASSPQSFSTRKSENNSDGGETDFIDAMISIMEENDAAQSAGLKSLDVATAVKSICISLLPAGSDGAAITLIWTLSLLLNHSHVIKKAQEELDKQVGKDRRVNDSDIKNLVYLQAIVKESMRLYPVAPISLPHEAMEDTNIAGFDVPKGTIVLTNLWKIHRDSSIWGIDALEFKPERFLNYCNKSQEDMELKGDLLLFSLGRRMCPGRAFALHILHVTLARLLHEFKLSTPSDLPVDMSEGFGLTLPKTTPLDVLLLPRLPSTMYVQYYNLNY